MGLARYAVVLRARGVPRLLGVGLLARGPVIATSAVLTLHVVLTLHEGYAQAGLLATVLTVSNAVGAPWRGRVVDRLGLRPALVPAIVLGGGVWLLAPFASYAALLAMAVVGGVFGLPAFAAMRQALSVAVPEADRRTALSLDSISVELSFMAGPALAVWAATSWSTGAVLALVGVAQVVGGALLWLLDPPLRSADAEPSGPAPLADLTGAASSQSREGATARAGSRHRRRTGGREYRRHAAPGVLDRVSGRSPRPRRRERWFTPPLLAVFVAGAGSTLVLSGTEVAVVSQLRGLHDVGFLSRVFVVWGITSIIGGFVYGALHREVSPAVVLLGLAVLTVPIGLGHSTYAVAALVGLAGLFCAPALTATSAALTRLVPERSRGEALGWQGAALTVGSGLGAPLAGVAVDHSGAGTAYLVCGLVGVGLALGSWALLRFRRPRPPVLAVPQVVDLRRSAEHASAGSL